MAAPTTEELKILKDFRLKTSDLGLENASDMDMLRWLRARDLNILAAEDILRKHLKWRNDEDLDHILEWNPPSNFSKDFGYEITGCDKEGHPICIVPFGQWDVRGVLTAKKGTKEDWFRNIDQMFARIYVKMEENSVEFGYEITQCILIVDFADFSMRQLTSFANVNVILEAVRRFEANYPEILFQFYFINAFRVFQMFFALMKPLLSVRTIAKLEIYTTPDKWLPVLLSRLPKDQLPQELGGTQKGRRVSIGSGVSEGSISLDDTEMATVEIPAGQTAKLEFAVTKPKSIIKWSFKLEAHDIGFFVTFKNKVMGEKKRFDSTGGQAAGSLICDKPGAYFLNFDNSYSRLRGKTVLYNVEVVDPTIAIKPIITEH